MSFCNRILPAVTLIAAVAGAGTPMSRRQSDAAADAKLDARVEELLGKMTLDEKLSLIHGDSKFTTAAIPRLGIPRRWLSDGPHGVREDVGPDTWDPAGHTDDFSTYLPANILLASTWNPDLAHLGGMVIGQEARARGKHIMLGPGVNIMRTPLNGRSFEYFGEDPYLTSRMAVGYIEGAQSQEISSCVKHFAGNNQETQRGSIDVEMDDRTLNEIYLPAFRAAVQEAGVWSVMGSYNKLRGQHCCENDLLLNQILKKRWGFRGLVVSDWGGVHDSKEAIMNGLDLEMGTNRPYDEFYMARPFREGLKNGTYPMSILDDKVRRNLRVMIATHMIDGRAPGSLNTAAHQTATRQIAEEGIVLLKNDRAALPLDANRIKSIAVIGEDAITKFAAGGQSAGIKAFYEVTPFEGIVAKAGGQSAVTYVAGYRIPSRRPRGPADVAGVRAGGANIAGGSSSATAEATRLADRAVDAARHADVAIVIAGLNHNNGFDTEGSDRKDLKLPYGQDHLIGRIVDANRHTIVVVMSGAPVELGPWLSRVPAVVETWYPGMEGGNALARVLFGDVNPSGKLPCTFPKALTDSPAHSGGLTSVYPGKNGVETYAEGLLVGYRWFDTKNIDPLFPFGFGLSYTTFGYSGLQTVPAGDAAYDAKVDVTNTGGRAGAEVVQLYVQPRHPSVFRPTKELKAFRKVFLKPGEKQTVTLSLTPSAFAFFDPDRTAWVAEPGDYDILIGSSSRDIRAQATVHLATTTGFK